VHAQGTCADEKKAIQEAVRVALGRSDIVFVSGGLGPTPDDITRESLAELFAVPLVFSKKQYREIVRYYRKRGGSVPKIVEQEAYFPANAMPVFNRYGIALGFIIEEKGKVIVVVPGVPGELTRLFDNHLKGFLKRRFPATRPFASLVVKTVGLSEPTVMKCLGRGFFKLGKFRFGIYPDVGEVALRIYAESPTVLKRLKRRIVKGLRDHIYAFSEEPIENAVGNILASKRWTLGLAESCTGGQVSEMITRVPGSSRYFTGTVVAYDNKVKLEMLQLPREVLRRKGAVSRESALSMAQGVRKALRTSLGVSVTGIAGPSGGTRQKPVGLVYIGIASRTTTRVWKELFGGDRKQIQDRASKKVLEYLWRWTQA
jgi:nicotinamide-nucleotide amidase